MHACFYVYKHIQCWTAVRLSWTVTLRLANYKQLNTIRSVYGCYATINVVCAGMRVETKPLAPAILHLLESMDGRKKRV